MRIIVNEVAYPLHGYTDSSEYTILGRLTSFYYLCEDTNGNIFALYLPNITEYYPTVR